MLNTALGIAIMSYDGRIFFGLLGDYDALADIDALASDLDAAIARAGGDRGRAGQARRRRRHAGPRVRRVLIAVAAVVVAAAAACVALISVLTSQDSSQVGGTAGPGTLEPDRGARAPDRAGDARLAARTSRPPAGRTARTRSRRTRPS